MYTYTHYLNIWDKSYITQLHKLTPYIITEEFFSLGMILWCASSNTFLWEVQRQRYRTHFQNCVLMIDEESKRYSGNNQKLNPGNKTLYITTQLIYTTLSDTIVGTDILQWTTIFNFLLYYRKVYWEWKWKAKCFSMYWFYIKGDLTGIHENCL